MKIICSLLFFLVSTQTQEFNFDDTRVHDAQKKFALITGNLMIGALFPIHEAPSMSRQRNPLVCGAIREQYGIQRVEAALQTIEQINKSPDILPNITLGIEIRDTCWSSLLALHQSLQFVQKLFVTKECTNSSEKTCQKDAPPILGVIGPASSEEAMQVQNLLQLFHIPQVGYSTTSVALSDKKKFQYFVRVVPSDNYQAQVMIEILQEYDWNYVFAVHSEGEYGRSGMNKFKDLADQNDICIASEHTIYDYTKKNELDDIVRKFYQNGKAKVVICFCEGYDVRRLLEATKRTNKLHNFVFIGGDGWAGRDDVVKDIEEIAQGNIMISLHSKYVADFDQYYFDIGKRNDSKNPWLEEFLNYRLNCTMKKARNMRSCTGNESLRSTYIQDPKLSFVIKAIYALAYALHNYSNDICGKNAPACSDLYPINGTLFMDYLRNVTFKYEDEVIEFDENGDPSARYDILNYQRSSNGTYDYVKVGTWINGELEIDVKNIQLPGRLQHVRSVCSEPCTPGHRKLLLQNGLQNKTCCWQCIKCKPKEISDGETCQPCNKGFQPNDMKNECVQMKLEYVRYSDRIGIICTFFSVVGIVSTLATMVVFYKYGNTPVVKSSTKELCYMMFAGMILAHSCTFILVGKPNGTTCKIARIIPGLSLSIMYSALLVKTNRIFRILSKSKKHFPTLRPKLISTTAQVSICGILISIEFLICVISIYLSPARPEIMIWQEFRGNISYDKAVLECYISDMSQELILQFIFNAVLLLFCIFYAFKTRKLPDNFNEAKCIGLACYATAITWLAFIAIYLGSRLQILSQCISLSISALINLIFLFFPKLYIMLCKPEKNNRAFFATSKNLRCHFGSTTLIHNCEQLMSGRIKNGYSSNVSDVMDINQLNKTIHGYCSCKSITNREITSKSCQTSLEKMYSEDDTISDQEL